MHVRPRHVHVKFNKGYRFVDLVNTFMEQYIKGSTQIFSLLKFNYSTSVALTC